MQDWNNESPASPVREQAHRIIQRLAGLELRARFLVQGALAGLHRSPRRGFSTEFSELRGFTPGDDPARIDWRAYARKKRLMVKTYEAETNLRAVIGLDVSDSMQYADPVDEKESNPARNPQGGNWSKAETAGTLAGALSLLFARQRDAWSVVTFADALQSMTPFRSSRNHLQECWRVLSAAPPGKPSDFRQTLQSLAHANRRAGLTLLISDFLCPINELDHGLGVLRAVRQEIILFQVLSRTERDPERLAGRRLVEPETGIEAVLPKDVGVYRAKVRRHVEQVREIAHKHSARYVFVPTETSMETTMVRFLTSKWK